MEHGLQSLPNIYGVIFRAVMAPIELVLFWSDNSRHFPWAVIRQLEGELVIIQHLTISLLEQLEYNYT